MMVGRVGALRFLRETREPEAMALYERGSRKFMNFGVKNRTSFAVRNLENRILFQVNATILHILTVTPHRGVWVETSECRALSYRRRVTPHGGVWVETWECESAGGRRESRPTGACELKCDHRKSHARLRLSRPTGACGLKRRRRMRPSGRGGSRPTRACELKPHVVICDSWIEIGSSAHATRPKSSHST